VGTNRPDRPSPAARPEPAPPLPPERTSGHRELPDKMGRNKPVKSILIAVVVFLVAILQPQLADARTRDEASAANKRDCLNWCGQHKYCHHCSKIYDCGGHYERIHFWHGYGDNWSACKKYGHVNRIWDDYKGKDIYPTTRVLLITLGGALAHRSSIDDGFEWFCEDYIYRTPLARKVKCISSYGAINTSSDKLSDNIINLINTIKSRTNRSPTVIFAAKSMGACKLQHALYKRSLKNYDIDTFFGIDTSCYVSKHWQDGEGLLFHHNVKTLQNFYETLDSSQTGHVLAYTDQYVGSANSEGEAGRSGDFHYTFDRYHANNQINVNTMNFDFLTMRKTEGELCNKVHHVHDTRPIDRCKGLRDGIFEYVKRKANESTGMGVILLHPF
jgi:hypothetical protein